MSAGKILVIRGGAIGDFILTLPALKALRTAFSEARLEVLGYPHIASLALLDGTVDQVHSIESRTLAGFFASGASLDDQLATFFLGFEVIISYLYDPDQVFRLNVMRCTEAQFIQGPHRPDEATTEHAAECFLKPLERLALFEQSTIPTIKLEPQAKPTSPNKTIAIHIGSGSESKNWPLDKWIELIQTLSSTPQNDLHIYAGEAEREKVTQLQQQLPERPLLKYCYGLNLNEVATSLKKSDVFVGHDSGITHLAAALGLPLVVLWADTNYEIWHPKSDHSSVLRHSDGIQQIAPTTVLTAISDILA